MQCPLKRAVQCDAVPFRLNRFNIMNKASAVAAVTAADVVSKANGQNALYPLFGNNRSFLVNLGYLEKYKIISSYFCQRE